MDRWKLSLFLVTWGGSVAAALLALFLYSAQPGEASTPPASWPAGLDLSPSPDRPNLVVSVHPQCSCTRATIAELARLMLRAGGNARVHALFVVPEGVQGGHDWTHTDLWNRVDEIPGATPIEDPGGRMATAFGMRTSGATALYIRGALAFHGGITPTRAHEGDSVGRRRLLALLRGGAPDRRQSDVYGCALNEPTGHGGRR